MRLKFHVPAVLALLLAAVGGSAQAAANWASTITPGVLVKQATALGQVPEDMPVHFGLSLKLRKRKELDAYLVNISTPGNPLYGQKMSTQEFMDDYAPTAEQAQSVMNYLKQSGFRNIEVEPNNTIVAADGTAGQAQHAFNTSIIQYQQLGRMVYANDSPAQVPAALGDIVLAVIGLQNVSKMHNFLAAAPAAGTPVLLPSFNAAAFQTFYNVGSLPDASDTTIAIISEGNIDALEADLRQYEDENKLPQVPYEVVRVGLPSSDAGGLVEFDMDTQTSTGLAGNVKQLIVYNTLTFDDIDLDRDFSRFASDNRAQAGSASLGECELGNLLDGALGTADQAFLQAAVQGQTMFASSGDGGGGCFLLFGVNGTTPDQTIPAGVNYPCSSAYVVCAGGTTLLTDSDYNRINEITWLQSGGGTSILEYGEPWQYGIVPTSSLDSPVGLFPLFRAVPDVSMDADAMLSPAAFVSNGSDTVNGGTSLSAPLALGAWARILSAHSNKLGFAAPLLYGLVPGAAPLTAATGFNDITVGFNGLFPATPGWDYTNGLGSFDISAISDALGPDPGDGTEGKSGAIGSGRIGRFGGALGWPLLLPLLGAVIRRREKKG